MSAAAIDYIWRAIQESERSDALQFRDDEMLITAAAQGSAQHRTVPPNAVGRKSIAEAAISPKPADNDSPQAMASPPLLRP
jgi:hypothetical protein